MTIPDPTRNFAQESLDEDPLGNGEEYGVTPLPPKQASAEVPDTITVPLDDWLSMFRRLGMAEGLLAGWLYAGRDNARAKAATEAFLARNAATGEG